MHDFRLFHCFHTPYNYYCYQKEINVLALRGKKNREKSLGFSETLIKSGDKKNEIYGTEVRFYE